MQDVWLMTLVEAAEFLRLDQRKVQRMARRGLLPGAILLPSGEVRFDRAHLLSWLKSRTLNAAEGRGGGRS